MTHDEMIAVIAHHKNGGVVQYNPYGEDEWRDCAQNDPSWDFHGNDYRAKPEPLVLWAVFSDGYINAYTNKETAYKTIALIHLGKPGANATIKKFTEATK